MIRGIRTLDMEDGSNGNSGWEQIDLATHGVTGTITSIAVDARHFNRLMVNTSDGTWLLEFRFRQEFLVRPLKKDDVASGE